MSPPLEKWWRGIKCYPCSFVRPSERPSEICCPLHNFWKTASIQFKFGMLIYNIKTQVKFDFCLIILTTHTAGFKYFWKKVFFCLIILTTHTAGFKYFWKNVVLSQYFDHTLCWSVRTCIPWGRAHWGTHVAACRPSCTWDTSAPTYSPQTEYCTPPADINYGLWNTIPHLQT